MPLISVVYMSRSIYALRKAMHSAKTAFESSLIMISNHQERNYRSLAIAVAIALACPPAWALDDDVLPVSLFASERYDSNLYRLPDGVQPFGDGRRSASTTTFGIGLDVNKTYGLQRFSVDGNVTRDAYVPYHFLNATTKTLNASWGWTLTPQLTGNLSYSRLEAPNNFGDVGVTTTSNVRRTEDRRFDIDYRPGASFHPRLSILQDEDKSQQPTFVRQNSKTTSIEGALVYEFRSGNFADVYFRRGKGNYENIAVDPVFQNDAQFNESETGVAAHYLSSGLSSFDGKIGYLTREHQTYASRNFNGLVGNLSYTYVATGKTQVQFNAFRNLSSTQALFSSYSQDTTVSVTPIWSATSKITVRPSYSILRRTFRGAIVPVEQDLELTTRTASLSIDWNVLRSLVFSFVVNKENRSANDRTYQYADHAASVRASIRF